MPSANVVQWPVFVTAFNGQVANLTVTKQAWQDLKLYYMTNNTTVPLSFTVPSYGNGTFTLRIQNISQPELDAIKANNAVIEAQGEVKVGQLTNLAAGIIGSQQVLTANPVLRGVLAFSNSSQLPPGGGQISSGSTRMQLAGPQLAWVLC